MTSDSIVTPPTWKIAVSRSPNVAVLHVKKGAEFKKIASSEVPGDLSGRVRLELHVQDRTVRFRAGGKELLQVTLEEGELHDFHRGVGCYDSWTRFRDIRFERN